MYEKRSPDVKRDEEILFSIFGIYIYVYIYVCVCAYNWRYIVKGAVYMYIY